MQSCPYWLIMFVCSPVVDRSHFQPLTQGWLGVQTAESLSGSTGLSLLADQSCLSAYLWLVDHISNRWHRAGWECRLMSHCPDQLDCSYWLITIGCSPVVGRSHFQPLTRGWLGVQTAKSLSGSPGLFLLADHVWVLTCGWLITFPTTDKGLVGSADC